jgi:hypothetical protein
MINRGLAWLTKHEETEADKIAHWENGRKHQAEGRYRRPRPL